MKYKIHVPVEQFGFIEADVDGTAEEVCASYRELSKAYQGSSGLEPKLFNGVLDKYLVEEIMDSEEYVAMSPAQQDIIQTIKRAKARIKSKIIK